MSSGLFSFLESFNVVDPTYSDDVVPILAIEVPNGHFHSNTAGRRNNMPYHGGIHSDNVPHIEVVVLVVQHSRKQLIRSRNLRTVSPNARDICASF